MTKIFFTVVYFYELSRDRSRRTVHAENVYKLYMILFLENVYRLYMILIFFLDRVPNQLTCHVLNQLAFAYAPQVLACLLI